MADRRGFAVAVAGNQFTVTWTDGSLFVCRTDDYNVVTDGVPSDEVEFGPEGRTVRLPWALETALGASSRSDFVAKINALAARDVSLSTVLGRAAAGQTVRVMGFNNASSANWAQSSYAGNAVYLTSAVAVRARGYNANDTAAGAGARTVRIEGLDANGAEVSETVSMAGVGYSGYTTQTFLRVNRAVVATAGTNFGVNYDRIAIEDASANVLRVIGYAETSTPGASYGAGVSTDGVYSVPAGFTAYVLGAGVYSSASGEWALYKHSFGTAVEPRIRLCEWYKPSTGQMVVEFTTPYVVPEKTDVVLRHDIAAAAGGWFDLALIPN